MICALASVRILKQELEKKFKTVTINLYIQASDNKFYIRDKEIVKSGIGVDRVFPLPITLKTLCSYDFYIDTSSIEKTYYYKHLSYVDSFLHKFGIDYTKIPDSKKYNKLRQNRIYKPSRELKEKMHTLRSQGKILLFHPFSPDVERSMPKDIAIKMINKLIKKMPDYTIVSTLKIDLSDLAKNKHAAMKDDRFEDLSSYSKSFFDFTYIISNMDKIITVDTATYHIADIYFVPTVVIFNDKKLMKKRLKYYHSIEPILLNKNFEKNYSKLKFETPELVLNKMYSWKELKVDDIVDRFDNIL
jgi:ADP-heptose:LPS heptosyltransferase